MVKKNHVSSGTSYEAIDRYVEELMQRLHIPGAALAVVEGERTGLDPNRDAKTAGSG